MRRRTAIALFLLLGLGAAARASAAPQSPMSVPNWGGQPFDPPPAPQPASAPATLGSDRLRISIDFLAGFGSDASNWQLGFEHQGRVGYATLTASGKLGSRVSYLISMNPINETDPVPGCGEVNYFYPNNPKFLYGADTPIPCQPDQGFRRVDFYRGIALDAVSQQAALREAYVDLQVTKSWRVRFGRTRLPIGFDWQEAGSFSAKDATRIQRIDARTNFGMLISYVKPSKDQARPVFTGTVGAYIGEGNRYLDYDYFYFEDGTLDANSAVTALAAASFAPIRQLEVRGAYQFGYTGSKVERLPSYWASKRRDHLLLISAAIRPSKHVQVIAERALYIWGPTTTSAAMLGVDGTPIYKNGFYVTGEAWWPITSSLSFGGSFTHEQIDRRDSLVRYAVEQNLFDATMDKLDTMTVFRFFVDIKDQVRIGVYINRDNNPFPWLSGIEAIAGPAAFQNEGTGKAGVIVRLRVH